ncbi:DinB family protein [Bacillus suaedaesalsae]|uniref:DinB family protein n=1 Tax=Bacillus suaedaesalsae TaxID=2810349 RepID=A0ABS2DHQ0_9BACI|nr:DinB family protein [Bacillus suaedaesalsae]MBM6617937.1 DinB family protein [Bacillus suaedaesalsae]
MNFNLDEAIEVLERTPQTLISFLTGLSDDWLSCNEGKDTWNAKEIVDHLIEAEHTNWIPRLETILQFGEQQTFPSFDRFAHMKREKEDSIEQRLLVFKEVRMKNIRKLHELIQPESFEKTGIHPEFGHVKLRELLSTWVIHDLTHLSQIMRVMAERYRHDVGPWKGYLRILSTNE